MADDKLKRGDGFRPKAQTCGVCDKAPETRCPSCPRLDGGRESSDLHWTKLRNRSPDEYAVQYPCAVAARNLVITHESHSLYPEYLDEYRRACDARDRYWEAKRAKLPKPQGTRHATFSSPADAAREAVR